MRVLSALLILACAITHAGAQVRTADPIARGLHPTDFPRFVKIADNVYGYEEIRQPGFTTVSLVVIGKNGVLLADGQGSPAATQTLLTKIATLTPLPVRWYVVGSDHGDHTGGNSVLPKDITFIVHPTSRAQLERDAASSNGQRVVIVPPVAMSGDRQVIDVGGTEVQVLFLGRAHTGGDLSVYLPASKTLFMSEAYLNRVFPAMRSAYPSDWVRAIDRALTLDVQRFVPGHGFIEEPAVAREELVNFRAALVAVIAEAKRLHTLGLTADDALKQANWGAYQNWFLADQQAPIALRRVYDEIEGRLAAGDSQTPRERVAALLAPWSKGNTPGAAVVVIRDGKVLLEEGYGLANLENGTRITPETRFLLASVTKQFTAMAIMMLAEQGKLGYGDRLTKFFPEFSPFAGSVTIRQLLNHTAGFPEYEDLFVQKGLVDRDWPRSATTARSSFEPTARDALKLLAAEKQLGFTPGEQWSYSNSGYVILAQIVEKVSGKSFAEYLRQNIFQPLGMNSSVLYDESRPRIPNVAASYTGAGGTFKNVDYTPFNAIYGEDNVYSTVADLYKWDQALYSEKLVKASTLKEAFTPGRLNDGTPTSYGFGWRVGTFLGQDEVSHGGSWIGFRTFILRIPDQHFTVVVLSNLAQFDPQNIAGKVTKIYLADKLKLPVARPLTADVAREYVGRYEFGPGRIAEITLENGVLWMKPPADDRVRIFSESADVFFSDGREETPLVFERDTNGRVISFGVRGGNRGRRVIQ